MLIYLTNYCNRVEEKDEIKPISQIHSAKNKIA